MEIWKDIKGYNSLYQVSSLGRVRSVDRVVQNGGNDRFEKGLLKKLTTNFYGYKIVVLSNKGFQKTYQVHQLVAIAFLGHEPCKYKRVVDHIDNVRTNNKLSNLQVISHRENCVKDKKPSKSEYTGVFWNKKNKVWYSQIRNKGKRYCLGSYNNEIDAHNAYQDKLNSLSNE